MMKERGQGAKMNIGQRKKEKLIFQEYVMEYISLVRAHYLYCLQETSLKFHYEWNNDEISLMGIEFVFSRIRDKFSKGKGGRL